MVFVRLKAVDPLLIAAAEDGNIYKFDLISGILLDTIEGHTQSVTGFVITAHNSVLSISLDGYMRLNDLFVSSDSLYIYIYKMNEILFNMSFFCVWFMLFCINILIFRTLPRYQFRLIWVSHF